MKDEQAGIIRFAFLGSPLFLMGVSYVVIEQNTQGALLSELGAELPLFLSGLAAVCIFFSSRLAELFSSRISSAQGTGAPKEETDKEQARDSLRFILELAIRDLGAVLGLVLSIVTGQFFWAFGLGLLSFLGMLSVAPPRRVKTDL